VTDRYAVIGNPVAHSRSPEIHAAFAAATGQDIAYGRLLAPPDGFAAAVARFSSEGGRGLNVTLPFKEEAWRLAATLSGRARRAGAANTLRLDGATVHADNTDGPGLVADLQRIFDAPVAGLHILLLGAGGAARGVVPSLLENGAASILVVNRSAARADALVAAMAPDQAERRVLSAQPAVPAGATFDLVINATAASLGGAAPDTPPGCLGAARLAYDMMYGHGDTPFMARARAEGARQVSDGLGMLVEQAAESFLLWRGVRPPTAAVLEQLRRA